MAHNGGFSFQVGLVIVGIIYIYLTTIFVFIDQWFGSWTSNGIINAVAFTGVAVMCVFNYVSAMVTDPGRVPSTFAPDIEDTVNPIQEIKRKSGELRYCQKCLHYKPPRTHHCRICKRCVLRMDHHCIWMNTCVGHANYKIFLEFVMYAVVACIYSLVLLIGSLSVDAPKDKQQAEGYSRSVYVIASLLLVPLTVALSILFGWHIYLILQNKTTIEYHEGVRSMLLSDTGGEVYSHPYDLGIYENLISVLGPNILCWILPVSSYIGSGLHFRTGIVKTGGGLMAKR